MTEEVDEAVCRCDHAASWHLKSRGHASQVLRRLRCLAKVKDARGFPYPCSCRAYRAAA